MKLSRQAIVRIILAAGAFLLGAGVKMMSGDSVDNASKDAAGPTSGGMSGSRGAKNFEGREIAGGEAWGSPDSEFVYFDYADREKMLAKVKGFYLHDRVVLDKKMKAALDIPDETERELLSELGEFFEELKDLEASKVEAISNDGARFAIRIPGFADESRELLRDLAPRLTMMMGKDKGEVLLRMIENDFHRRLGEKGRTLTFTRSIQGKYKIENFEEGANGPKSHSWLEEMPHRWKHLGSFEDLREGRVQ